MPHSSSQALIQVRYEAIHAAAPTADYPNYLSVGDPEAPLATLGMRTAGDGPLFLERYLPVPIEALIEERMQRTVSRERIVELGHHASISAVATGALWHKAALALAERADVAVAVLTRPLRDMLHRAGLIFIPLVAADPAALGDDAIVWGRYYATEPIVCAGWITDNVAALARMRVGGGGR